jgi:hypothetical protein
MGVGLRILIRLGLSSAAGLVGLVAGGFVGLVMASLSTGGVGLHGLDAAAMLLLLGGCVGGVVVGSTLGAVLAGRLIVGPGAEKSTVQGSQDK